MLLDRSLLDLHECRHGSMLAFRADEVIGRSLRLYGEWSEHELSILCSYIKPDSVVMDIGANIGTHTLAFAEHVPGGSVIAVEPQGGLMSILQVNCMLNRRSNVEFVRSACGKRSGVVEISTFDCRNPGATRFRSRKSRRHWRAEDLPSSSDAATAPMIRIDDLLRNRHVSLIKIDAEGMELDILLGARKVLRACQPVLFLEQNDTSALGSIHDLLAACNYRLYWMETHQFNQDNFRGNPDNIWWRTEMGILALAGTEQPPDDLVAVDRSSTTLPFRQDARTGIPVARAVRSNHTSKLDDHS